MKTEMSDVAEREEALGARPSSWLGALAKRWMPYAPVALVTAALALYSIRGVLAKCGHPGVPLDDAFIHFQYAKRIAGGHFFSYVDGEGYSSGATSLVWPVVLAPFYLVGFRDLSIIWAAWLLGFFSLGALAVETYRLSVPLAGRAASVGAGAMVLCFGGYVWCAASGMEVVPLAWALAFGLRKSIEWGEAPRAQRSERSFRMLMGLSLVAPLLRPEGALVSLAVLIVLAAFPGPRPRATALFALVGVVVVPLLNLAFTGRAASSTTIVKWLPGNPYYGHGEALVSAVRDNARLFFDTLVDGREWSAVYIPSGSRPYAIAALFAIPAAGWFRARPLRAGFVFAMALGILVPCTYLTFLWNRLRYLWPFAFAWFVGLACLAASIGEVLALVRPRWRLVGGVLSGLFAGALASRLGWTFDDLWGSASAIDRQQVALGRWAEAELEPGARIGVNDTGAIGYLGGHKTFDVVGLTTREEAPYWVAGAGSRFEHYERLFRSSPERLPTHFIVYPHWMACDPVLGDELHEETVTDQTILGGTTMTAYAARYDQLGSGDLPAGDGSAGARPIDELDVADLESEAAHAYELGPARDTDDVVLTHAMGSKTVADGARMRRTEDRFTFRGRTDGPAVVVARLTADAPTEVEARVGGEVVGTAVVSSGWTEARFEVPRLRGAGSVPVSVAARGGGHFGSAHYWLYER
jgi:hypothetical protein